MLNKKAGKLLVIKPPYDAWPVGFAYVLSCLEENGIPFDFIDSSNTQNFRQNVKNRLANNDYFAVASGGLIGFCYFFKEIAQMIRKYHRGIPLIIGGNITKDASNELLFDYIGINFGVLGEAETSLPGLINAINMSNGISDLPGVIYKKDGKIVKNLPHRFDLNKNILPAWHRFDVDFYIKNSTAPFIGDDLRFMPVLTGRGCVGRCTFCSPSIGGFRKRPIEHVIFEIEQLSSKYKFDKIFFYNEMFYPTAHEISDFCEQYMLLKNKKPWITQVRIDSNIDVKTFVQMKEAGCIVVSAGIESGSDKVLSLMNKNITSEQIRIFFRNAKMADMPTNGTFIVGNEGETEEDLMKTIDLVIGEEINTGESLMYVYPGTIAYNNALKRGLIKDEKLHLRKTSKSATSLFSQNVKENHLNISKISDERFLDIVTREARRYNTFVFNRYPVKDLSFKIMIQDKEVFMLMRGKCHECGFDVKNEYNIFNKIEYVGLLGQGVEDKYICSKCFSQLSFNIYECKEIEGIGRYFSFLKDNLSKHKRIIIGGINEDARFMLRINLLDLDYKKILGFCRFTVQQKGKYFVNFPVFNFDDVIDLNPSCILMVDSISNGESIIRKYYARKKISPPEFVYLFDKQLLDTLKKIKSEGGYGNYSNNLVLWFKNKYLYLRNFCEDKNIYFPPFF
jgi:radical SAM superfamily enzyme YgiQ (UPF0313 family)